jgi:formylglycine-generating enzyme required for sulfatase activity
MTTQSEPVTSGTQIILPTLRALPGGAFLLGDENGRSDERLVHEVTIDPFSIAIHPVSNAEYAVFLEKSGHPEPIEWRQPRFDRSNCPVCGVSWTDAVAYAD